MHQITKTTAIADLKCFAIVQSLPIAGDFHVFKQEFRWSSEAASRPDIAVNVLVPENTERQGIITTENLIALRAGQPFTAETEIWAFNRPVREAFRDFGWEMAHKAAFSDPENAFLERLFDRFAAGSLSAGDIVRFDNASKMAFTLDGAVLPKAILFDPDYGRITDQTYDVKLAAEHLLARDDVVLFKHSPFGGWGRGVAKTVKAAIGTAPIEQHDEDVDYDAALCFLWRPNFEDSQNLWAQCQSYGGLHPSTEIHRAVFDADLIGLRAAGAAKGSDYWYSEPEEDEDDLGFS